MVDLRRCASLLLIAAVAGAPLARLLRVAEIAPANRNDAPRYALLFAGLGDDSTEAPRAPAKDAKKTAPESGPKLLRPVADHWDKVTRVHLDSAALVPLNLPALVLAQTCEVLEIRAQFIAEHIPPHPPGRGPPAA